MRLQLGREQTHSQLSQAKTRLDNGRSVARTSAIGHHFDHAGYFYRYASGGNEAEDPEGLELPDIDRARAHAVREIRMLLSEEIAGKGTLTLSHRIDIEDSAGAVLSTVWFRDAVAVHG